MEHFSIYHTKSDWDQVGKTKPMLPILAEKQ